MTSTYYKSGEDYLGNYLESITENEFGDITNTRRTYCPSIRHEHDGKVYFLQYDDDMHLLYDACNYLNFHISSRSMTTRRFSARVMRQYICFMELAGFQYNKDLSDNYVIEQVCNFFLGKDFRAETKILSSMTVNNYIAVIRDFFCYLNVREKIQEKSIKDIKRFINIKFSNPKLRSSLRNNPHANDNVRPFISPDEFLQLRELAINKNDVQALMLFHLMYFYGLRIGECLSLTEEDFEIRQHNYNPSPTIFLRNRLSDKEFQYAKNLPHPSSKNEYTAKTYPSQKVKLSIAFYTKLTEFVESVKQECQNKGTYSRAEADSIFRTRDKQENHYIFRNIYGKPLSQQTWNLRLKDYFTAAMIPLDTGTRHDSLNHRFRHGCAMYYLRFADEGHRMTIEQVAALLRHKSLATIQAYLKVTLDDEFELKQQFQDYLLNEIQALKTDY